MKVKDLSKFLVIFLVPVFVTLYFFLATQECSSAWTAGGFQGLNSSEAPWEISAKRLEYHEKEGVYIAEGNVIIQKGAQVLKATRAIYDQKSGVAKVWGNVRFETQGDVITGQKAVFYLKEQTGKIDEGHIFLRENHLHISSSSLEKISENTYLARDCKITTCDGPRPAWSITASEVKVTLEGYGTAKHAAFRIKNVPVLFFPYFIFPAKTKRQTGLLPPRMGYSDRNGLDVEIPFFLAISDQTDATFYERYMTERGYMQGIEFRYITSKLSKGAFLLDIMSDRKDKDLSDPDEAELSPLSRTNKWRYWFRGKADQDLPLGVQARLDADYVSDQDYLSEFTNGLFGYEARPDLQRKWGRPIEERLSPLRSSNLLLSRLWEGITIQADSHYYQHPDHPHPNETPEPLLGLHFSKLINRVPTLPLFYCFGIDYNNIWRYEGDKGNGIAVSPKLTIPLRLGQYLELEPTMSLDYEAQWVDQEYNGTEYRWARGYQGKVRLSSRMERLFDVSIGQTDRLRHTIRPSLFYTYHEERSNDDLSWFDAITDEGKVNKITMELENFLDTRSKNRQGKLSYHQWASLSLIQSYNIDEARKMLEPGAKRRPFDPLRISLIVKPLRLIDIYWLTQWDHYENEFKSNDLSVELTIDRSSKKKDHYKVEYQSEKGEYRNLHLTADVGLWGGFSAGGGYSKDFYANEEISSNLWLKYRAQCWGIKVMAQRENEDTRFMVLFELKGVGQFRAW